MRAQIQEAYGYALTHPKEAKASGTLGMILHTYSLLREAINYYQYAADLAPDEFRWTYYLGLVEAQQGRCEQAAANLRLALRMASQVWAKRLATALATGVWAISIPLCNS